jgi:hypothetical protein
MSITVFLFAIANAQIQKMTSILIPYFSFV